jgi:transcriptional antiterminator
MALPVPRLKKIKIAQRKKQLITLMRTFPDMNQQELADELNVNRSTVQRDLKEINEELNMQTVEDFMVQRQRILSEIHEKKQLCMDKLKALNHSPHQGARWMEEYSKLLEKEIRIYGIYSPEKMMIKHSQEFTKEQKDAAVNAAIGVIEKNTTVIDLTPKKSTSEDKDKPDDDSLDTDRPIFSIA